MNEPLCLVKIGEYQHLNRLVEHGELFMRSFRDFWNIEDADKSAANSEESGLRRDPREGIASQLLGTDAEVWHNGVQIPLTVTSWRFHVHPRNPERYNIFSMYCWRLIQEPLSAELARFGPAAAVVFDVDSFMNRVESAMVAATIRWHFGCVAYVPEDYFGQVGLFRKFDRFKWQSEFRLITDRDVRTNEPLIMSLGSLKHCVVTMPVEQVSEWGAAQAQLLKHAEGRSCLPAIRRVSSG